MKNAVKTIILTTLTLLLATGSSLAYRPLPFSIQVYGVGATHVEFSGWCAVEIGNRTLLRSEFSGSNQSMEPVVVYGRYIDSCEVTNLTGEGEISLVLQSDGNEIYRKSSDGSETTIKYGPTMQRYSTRPPTMQ